MVYVVPELDRWLLEQALVKRGISYSAFAERAGMTVAEISAFFRRPATVMGDWRRLRIIHTLPSWGIPLMEVRYVPPRKPPEPIYEVTGFVFDDDGNVVGLDANEVTDVSA